ncbi:unnamed protein product [Parnassius apollo]|uniref:(apollo) hypothetical protein n=1 Tax=Parnassius apollo TaxID=110799 RepID=A0A8S3Y864_PARAO|nr:unnamed protein product [Parnassius apollo]
MKCIKARLMEIILKVDNYIYREKPISKRQAKTYLNEISSFITQCNNDIGYLQVIEKLTKYMNIIISSATSKAKVIKTTNQDKTAALATNTHGSSLSPVSFTPVNDRIQNQHNIEEISESNGNFDLNNNNTNCHEDEQNARNKTAEIEKLSPEVSTIDNLITNNSDHLQVSQNILENFRAKSIDNADIFETNRVFSQQGVCQNVNASAVSDYINKKIGNKNQNIASFDSESKSKVTQNVANYNNRQVTNEEILETDALSKEKVSNEKSALNAVTLNTSYSKIKINEHEQLDERTKTVNNTQLSQINDEINVNVLTDDVDKKKVTFNIPTQNETLPINMHKGEKGNGNISISRTNKIKKRIKNSNQNPQKKTRSTIKRQKKDTSNCKAEKNTKRNTNKRKTIKACEDKTAENSNKISSNTSSSLCVVNTINGKIEDDLSWLDQIKYVRVVDAREYCTFVQGLDDKFWENETVPKCDDEEFNV